MSDKPPKGAVASADDFQVQRDEKGDLLPVWEPIPGVRMDCPDCGGSGRTLETAEDGTEYTECDECDGTGDIPKVAKVIPLTQGTAQKYLPSSGDPGDISDRKTAVLLNEFFVEPDFEVDKSNAKEALDDFAAFGVEPLILCLYNASGFEMAKGMVLDNAELTQQIEGNSKNGS